MGKASSRKRDLPAIARLALPVDLFARALQEAFRFDEKVLVEEAIRGRELECGVIGNEEPEASVVGEVIAHGEFYSYQAKYVDEHGASLNIPAAIPAEVSERLPALAVAAFGVLNCAGMARADFFLADHGRLLVNEIDTIPGFTNISMFPLLWEASGLSYSDLVDRLITLALRRHAALNSLSHDIWAGAPTPELAE
jgi:D-alanine-D-alanine ligase